MPNRWVREDAIESETVNAVSWQAEVFWRRLLNRCDDFGRYSANIKLLRTQIFPLQTDKVSELDVARLLSECESVGLLFGYKGPDGKPYLAMNKFERGRAKHSKYPDPPPEVAERMRAFVYTCMQTQTNAPTSDFRLPTSDPDFREPTMARAQEGSEFFPTLEDIKTAANGPMGATPECAEAFWNEMEACGWRDSKNRPIGKWRNAFNVYAMRWRANEKPRNQSQPGSSWPSQPPSIYSLQKQLEAVEREIKKIQNRGHEDPVAGLVIRIEDRTAYRDLKKRRDELNAQIAKGGQ